MHVIPGQCARILVIKWGALGDLIAGTTALRALREHYPASSITVYSNPLMQQVCPPGTLVDEILTYETGKGPFPGTLRDQLRIVPAIRSRRPDLAINLRWNSERSAIMTGLSGARLRAGSGPRSLAFLYNCRPPRHTGRRHEFLRHLDILEPLGIVPARILPFVHCSRDDIEFAAQWYRSMGLKRERTVGMHPGASNPTKAWPWESYAECARRLCSIPNLKVVVTWGPGERETAERVVGPAGGGALLAPETPSIGRLAALIGSAGLFVCNYSGPMNIAMAVETPLVALGCSSPEDWGPLGDLHRTINKAGDRDSYTNDERMLMMRKIGVDEVVGMAGQRLRELYPDFTGTTHPE